MIPVTIPSYHQADQHVIVETMPNYEMAGKNIQTRLTRRNISKWIIYFKTSSFTLDESQKQLLQQLNRHYSYSIIGFASMMGSSIVNEEISKQRADMVYQYLNKSGIKVCHVQHHVLSISPPYRAQRVEVSINRC